MKIILSKKKRYQFHKIYLLYSHLFTIAYDKMYNFFKKLFLIQIPYKNGSQLEIKKFQIVNMYLIFNFNWLTSKVSLTPPNLRTIIQGVQSLTIAKWRSVSLFKESIFSATLRIWEKATPDMRSMPHCHSISRKSKLFWLVRLRITIQQKQWEELKLRPSMSSKFWSRKKDELWRIISKSMILSLHQK